MPLPKEKSKKETDLGAFSILLYRPAKLGKSTWAASFEDAMVVSTEPALKCLSVYKSDITTWKGFLEDLNELIKSKSTTYKTLVIDTIDNLYKFCSEHVCKELGIKHESDLGFGIGFSMVNSEFQRVLTRISMLPYGLILISHSKEKEVDTRLGKI